jgi:proteasome lid subunit RPN8/RPN11
VHALVLLATLLFSDLSRPQAAVWYASLLEESGHGRLPRECAAFLIREADGTLTLAPWPHGGQRHVSFRGHVPARTIAILHTHPRGEERPSARDRDEARRLGLPVVTITSDAVIAVMPDGGEVTLGSAYMQRESRPSP